MKVGPFKIAEKIVIGIRREDGIPLLIRFVLFRAPAIGVYLHKLCRSDYDRALHDHPWPFISIILTQGYTEVHDQTLNGLPVQLFHKRGSVLLRPAEWRHRVIIHNKPAWTLVIVGRRQRRWGFHLSTGWCWWRQHNPSKGICEERILWKDGSD